VAYWHRRYEELAGTRPLPPRVLEAKPPLTWGSYSALLNTFQRSLEFQRAVTRWLQQAEGSRQWLPGMKQPRADLQEVHAKYSGTVEVRRPGHPLFKKKVEISEAHVVYDGKLVPPPIRRALSQYAQSRGTSLHFHDP
jgi:hypothetical protein